ncbi:MAG: DUF350 domain-containing protein [Acidobacteria bacterium]|nr:DUF350 domain-containing protein [Acidobacteriota bacterium]
MMEFHIGNLINAFVYALLGIFLFVISFAILDKLTPYALWDEIVAHKNVALAIMVGFMSLGMCIIIAAAVH